MCKKQGALLQTAPSCVVDNHITISCTTNEGLTENLKETQSHVSGQGMKTLVSVCIIEGVLPCYKMMSNNWSTVIHVATSTNAEDSRGSLEETGWEVPRAAVGATPQGS